MIAKGTAENCVKFVHSLLRWWLCLGLPLAHVSVNNAPLKLNIEEKVLESLGDHQVH